MAILDTRGHIETEDAAPCWECGDDTRWVEVNFEARICPGPCTVARWAAYDAAYRGVPFL